mmetsp:Transcript_5490/g.16695  ORF Transcript_5490/g.16695 Transcript_5490/m.16695 type:complete len:90 (+) Transcript_5490:326-595(+)
MHACVSVCDVCVCVCMLACVRACFFCVREHAFMRPDAHAGACACATPTHASINAVAYPLVLPHMRAHAHATPMHMSMRACTPCMHAPCR